MSIDSAPAIAAAPLRKGAPVVELTGIHKSFGPLEVLQGISFTASEGEVVALIGSSGSGKSTLLRCINMLEVPEQGIGRGSPARRSSSPRRVPTAASPTRTRSAASAPSSAWCSSRSTSGAT